MEETSSLDRRGGEDAQGTFKIFRDKTLDPSNLGILAPFLKEL